MMDSESGCRDVYNASMRHGSPQGYGRKIEVDLYEESCPRRFAATVMNNPRILRSQRFTVVPYGSLMGDKNSPIILRISRRFGLEYKVESTPK